MPAPPRLSVAQVRQHLRIYDPPIRRLATELRRIVLAAVPTAAEKIAFGSLCYYQPGCLWGVVGGHICFIAPGEDDVALGFIHGADLDDPRHLLSGNGKSKRTLSVGSLAQARSPAVVALVRSAARRASAARLDDSK